LTDVLPKRILEFSPGAMNDLHFLQKTIRRSYGIRILYLLLIRRAIEACLWDNSGSVLALLIALSIKICILSIAIL